MRHLVIGIAFIICVSAHAFVSKCPGTDKLAEELLQLELSGRRYANFQESCVHKLQSDTIWMRHDPVDDSLYEFPSGAIAVKNKSDAKITELKKDKFPDRWLVNLTVNGEKDNFVMEVFSQKIAKKAGCAAIVKAPDKFWVYSDCMKK